jgi:MFS superfamily sulfate permease-like transporter
MIVPSPRHHIAHGVKLNPLEQATPAAVAETSRDPEFSTPTWRGEIGGALGDLGTLLPYLVGFISIAGVNATSVLLAFGLSSFIVGWRFHLPFPVQPMKAIGAASLAQAALGSASMPEVLAVAAFLTGIFWLVAGWTELAGWLARHVSKDIVHGIVLGLGMALILEGLRRIEGDLLVGAGSVLTSLVLLRRSGWVLMPLLLAGGLAVGWTRHPELASTFAAFSLRPAAPIVLWSDVWRLDIWLGALALASAQVPLTFGNAILGVVAETHRYFPSAKLDETKVARSTGLMNLLAASLGAPPMCHGAGGLAAHIAFGARTGRAPMMLGAAFILIALFASSSIKVLLDMLPSGTLGAMLFVTGLSLAMGTAGSARGKDERAVLLATAAVSIWSAGVGLVFGLLFEFGLKRRVFKL